MCHLHLRAGLAGGGGRGGGRGVGGGGILLIFARGRPETKMLLKWICLWLQVSCVQILSLLGHIADDQRISFPETFFFSRFSQRGGAAVISRKQALMTYMSNICRPAKRACFFRSPTLFEYHLLFNSTVSHICSIFVRNLLKFSVFIGASNGPKSFLNDISTQRTHAR